SVLRMIGEDGLAWTPLVGRPWGTIGMESGTCVPEGIDISTSTEYLDATLNGGLLNALTVYCKRDRNDLWKQTAERMVDGLSKVVVDRDRYAYYSPNPHFVISGSTDDWGRRHPMWGVGSDAVHGMLFLYRETGYEPSLRLAGKLMHYVLDEIQHIAPDGSYTPDAKLNDASPARFDSSSLAGPPPHALPTLAHRLLAKTRRTTEAA